MHRRTFLALTGAWVVAACSSGEEGGVDVDGTGGLGDGTGTGDGIDVYGVETDTLGGVGTPQPTIAYVQQAYGDTIYFGYDSSSVEGDAQHVVRGWAEWMMQFPSVFVVIQGHCDERGTREYNLALGDRRATAVKNFLVSMGIGPDRIQTISYGKERPAVGGHSEADLAQNRRAVLALA